jgi:hypothetical protein
MGGELTAELGGLSHKGLAGWRGEEVSCVTSLEQGLSCLVSPSAR